MSARDRTAEHREPSSRRLFCALDPPPEIVAAIAAWQGEQLAGRGADAGLRAVRPEALHLTVAFLGAQPPERRAAVAELVGELPARPIGGRLRPAPVPLPRRRPKLFALEVESRGAERLAAEVREKLALIGVEPPDRRPLWPHLTVFRVKRGRRGGTGARRAPIPRLEPLPEGDGRAFGFVRFALYLSELRPEGSKYTRLAAKDLH